MRSFTHSFRLAIAAVLCLAFSWTAHAANNAYMRIEGTKPGHFKGEGMWHGSNQWIPVSTVEFEAESPRDASTGQSSGKRQHKPVKVTMELGAASLQLQEALAQHEQLKEVVIELVRRDPQGKEEVFQTITLSNAAISSIQRLRGKDGHENEEISFIYENVRHTFNQGTTPTNNAPK